MIDKLKKIITDIRQHIIPSPDKPKKKPPETRNNLKHIFWNIGWN